MDLQKFINTLSKQIYGRTRSEAQLQQICVDCGKPATEFRDGLSAKEYTISGFCQQCQDKTFGSDA